MLRYGIISEVDYNRGLARVFFDEINITSGWLSLPCSMRQVKYWPVNCQVSVEMHDNLEDGEILHRTMSDNDEVPTWAAKGVEGYQFSDGTSVYYNATTKKLIIDAGSTGELEFNCSKLTVSGDVVAGVSKISLTTHTHTSPVGPTGTPIPTP